MTKFALLIACTLYFHHMHDRASSLVDLSIKCPDDSSNNVSKGLIAKCPSDKGMYQPWCQQVYLITKSPRAVLNRAQEGGREGGREGVYPFLEHFYQYSFLP